MTISNRDIAITAGITIVIAVVIFIIFLLVSGQKQDKEQDQRTQDLIDQIKQQSADADKDISEGSDKDDDADEDKIEQKTFTGVLETVNADLLLVMDSETEELIRITITDDTSMIYNNERFYKEDFYAGDQLQILAEKSKQGGWEALDIIVKFSASPETAAPVPQGLEQRPTGEFKPLGNS